MPAIFTGLCLCVLPEGVTATNPGDQRIATVTVAKRKAALDKAAAAAEGEEAAE